MTDVNAFKQRTLAAPNALRGDVESETQHPGTSLARSRHRTSSSNLAGFDKELT
jgi:hypothetical protein